ncbi:MAG: cytochrome c biogenesis protein CcsA [Bacteroidota bacterium]
MAGTIILVIALVSGLVAVWSYYQSASGTQNLLSLGRKGLYVSAAAIIAAAALLLGNILRHDFSFAYVWNYSDRKLPLQFLISTFYAGQEGSFLFWAFCSSILSFFVLHYTRTRKLEAHVLAIFLATQSFLVLILLFKSPFTMIWDAFPGQILPGQIPADGKGLNPLLQNFWMVVHPPVLFIGFAVTAVPFSFAVAALWRKDFTSWVTSAFPWALFSGLILGVGIMLGAYWAYGVLGWGGYWGWDPVENSSLIPWLVLMALVHTMVIQKRTGNFVRMNFVLAILSFFFVIYSTFLTRSGVLGDSSVHSFTDPGAAVYGLLIVFLVAVALLGFGMMYFRRHELRIHAAPLKYPSRGFVVSLGSFALLALSAVVLFGTSLPIFSKTTVESSFYDTMSLPIAAAIALLIGWSLLLRWENEDGSALFKRSLKWIIASLIVASAMAYFGVRDIVMLFFGFSSAFAFFVNIEIAYLTAKGDPRLMGGKIAHIGLALFFLGVLASGKYGEKQHLALSLNMPQQAFGYTLTYKGSRPVVGKKFAFDIEMEKGATRFQLSPVMFETGDQGTMRRPDIKSFLTSDIYISPVSLDRSENTDEHGGEMVSIKKGETVSLGNVKATFVKFDMGSHGMDAMTSGGGMAVGSVLELTSAQGKETVTPVAVYTQQSAPTFKPAASKLLGANIQLVSMNIDMGSKQSIVTLEVVRPNMLPAAAGEVLEIEASMKPLISLVWSGTILLFIGLLVSMLHRKHEA